MSSLEESNAAMAAAGGHLNQSSFFSSNPSRLISVILASACLGFTGFEALGQRSVDLSGRHRNSRQHQLSRELADHGGSRQRALLSHPLPFGEQRKQGMGGGTSFMVHTLSHFLGFGLCLNQWGMW